MGKVRSKNEQGLPVWNAGRPAQSLRYRPSDVSDRSHHRTGQRLPHVHKHTHHRAADLLLSDRPGADRTTHKMVDTGFPDHKERREAGRAIMEYLIGKAIERSLEVGGNYKELSQVLEELKQTPEGRRILPPEIWGMVSGQSAAPSHQEEAISPPEQKTG
jgi:hypothetical protein